jgi:putative membrane protein
MVRVRWWNWYWSVFWPPLPIWRRLDTTVILVAVYTAAVVFVDQRLDVHVPDWGGMMAVLNALILGVLLAFRNREAYDRWWEGRKLWGQLVNDSRNLCLKVRAIPSLTSGNQQYVGQLLVGFAVALKNHLRGSDKLQLVPGFEAAADSPDHPPRYLAGKLFESLRSWRREDKLSDFDLLLLDPHAKALMDVAGACERIRSTPLPLSYRALVRHGLALYVFTIPWFIADHLLWWTVPDMALFTYFLFGIEFTAEDVEEPFGRDADDLALSTYCETIRRSVVDTVGIGPPPNRAEQDIPSCDAGQVPSR